MTGRFMQLAILLPLLRDPMVPMEAVDAITTLFPTLLMDESTTQRDREAARAFLMTFPEEKYKEYDPFRIKTRVSFLNVFMAIMVCKFCHALGQFLGDPRSCWTIERCAGPGA